VVLLGSNGLASTVPHAPYTHEVVELTDGRCYCLTCDEVVARHYLDGLGRVRDDGPERAVENEPVQSTASRGPSTGD